MNEINGLHWPQAVFFSAVAMGAGVAFAGFMLAHGIAEIGEGLKRVGLGLETAARLRRDEEVVIADGGGIDRDPV